MLYLAMGHLFAQDKIQFALKDSTNAEVYIDGKKYDYTILRLLDQSKIESVMVVKDQKALKEYNTDKGVIVIKTKNSDQNEDSIGVRSEDDDKQPMFMIDGKVGDRKVLELISPDDIKTITVVKGEKALKDYNAPNGVIIITTKEQN